MLRLGCWQDIGKNDAQQRPGAKSGHDDPERCRTFEEPLIG